MSSGIRYRLGILTGFVRGYEYEKDLLRLAQKRLMKRKESKEIGSGD